MKSIAFLALLLMLFFNSAQVIAGDEKEDLGEMAQRQIEQILDARIASLPPFNPPTACNGSNGEMRIVQGPGGKWGGFIIRPKLPEQIEALKKLADKGLKIEVLESGKLKNIDGWLFDCYVNGKEKTFIYLPSLDPNAYHMSCTPKRVVGSKGTGSSRLYLLSCGIRIKDCEN